MKTTNLMCLANLKFSESAILYPRTVVRNEKMTQKQKKMGKQTQIILQVQVILLNTVCINC